MQTCFLWISKVGQNSKEIILMQKYIQKQKYQGPNILLFLGAAYCWEILLNSLKTFHLKGGYRIYLYFLIGHNIYGS